MVRSRLKWASHVERKGDTKNWWRSDALKVKGKRTQGRLKMQWEDFVKRGLVSLGGEWRTTAKDRRSWRLLLENIVR